MNLRKVIWSIALGLSLSSNLGLAATTTRVSVNSLGEESKGVPGPGGDADSHHAAISAEGRFVAFVSFAINLVADDDSNPDVFVHDRQTGKMAQVNVNSRGQPANGFWEQGPVDISASGRFVAFVSESTNLVDDDPDTATDVFVHDRDTGETTQVSVDSFGGHNSRNVGEMVAISGDGRFVAFVSPSRSLDFSSDDDNGDGDVFVHDRETGETKRVSINSRGEVGNKRSGGGDVLSQGAIAINGDGRFVAFESDASNLVPNDTNRRADLFVHDRQTGKTSRVSVNSRGQEGNEGIDTRNLSFGGVEGRRVAISASGRFVAFHSYSTNLAAADTNVTFDVFVHDRETGTTSRVSVNSRGQEANQISCCSVAISADGRYVAFASYATNLVADDSNDSTDVFVHDRKTGKTNRVSTTTYGKEANGGSGGPAISARGRYVAFSSDATDLVPNDSNSASDIFVADRDRDIVNGRVTLEPKANTFDMTDEGRECGDKFERRFRFKASLQNTGEIEFRKLHIPVTKLTEGNKLVTELGRIGPNGEFPVPERDDYSDGILSPGESVTVPLEVCLREREPFELYVDVADDRKTKVDAPATAEAEFRFIVGLDRDDTLKGTSGDDMLIGFDGNDTVRGKGGNDLILGGRGNDELSGDRGNDEIRGGDGRDSLRGGGGDDLLFGGRGNDTLLGNGDNDELRGNSGRDQLLGGGNDDLLKGGSGNDALDGGTGVDICKGGSGTNTLRRCEL